ncbi:MAG TPA: ATP-binding protein [Candidatus Egerieisoma faecipullorum]|uniref:ATP-binding protein n=1 Tax=Candidatus Egerieisoma faecipullorum TaxID=2840963 RepID=A0A9D1I774_9CLOT|nr:ATP-binding protein [Candidatus Egerieisoma faecipullorum]
MKQNNPPKRITSTIINALKGGVVPRVGLEYITVGREREISALLHDIDIIADGGAAFRFIVGKYGSGKSFLLQTIRNYAAERGFVVVDADLSPERRFTGSKGQGLATYKELVKNMSTKTKPDGGALPLILERWISGIRTSVAVEENLSPEDPAFDRSVEKRIHTVTASLEGMVNGFEFARAVLLYYRAYLTSDDQMKSNVIRWFRGEYPTRTEARQDLNINFIVTDENWYDVLKILSAFIVHAGYKGLLVIVDELVNIFKIPQSAVRQNNYEKILTMYNDVLQGKARNIGFFLGGTPQCIEDKYKGVFSYEALRSRLSEGRFAEGGGRDMLSPIIRLNMLNEEELYVLIEKLVQMHAQLFEYSPKITHEELVRFLQIEFNRVGAESHITPREIIRDFIELLNILFQSPERSASELLEEEQFLGKPSEEEVSLFQEFEL